MSAGILLANRLKFLEPYFGGLDRIYRSHKSIATLAIIFLLLHFFIVSIGRGINFGASLGKIALIGLLLSVILALAPRIPFLGGYIRLPYHRWRVIHKFTGLFLIIGVLHSYRIDNLMQHSPVVNGYVRIISFIGIAAYLYRELLHPLVHRGYAYIVEDARRLNGTVLEIVLRPERDRLAHRPGQFLFIRFNDPRLREPHPFTISSAPESDALKLAVRASGDFTQNLHKGLSVGTQARLEGGYGMFDYHRGGDRQIWVAGGIGVTPFLSWIRSFDGGLDRSVDFFYSVRSEDEALYLDEIESAQAANPSFHVYVHLSNHDGRLDGEKIARACGDVAGREVYLCGPFPMTMALIEQLRRLGVQAGQIHYEEFNFR
jgi:predicted ferric reductase